MSVFYYYYYLFYKKNLKDEEPHLLTILVLSASCSFPVIFILQMLLAEKYCLSVDSWKMFLIIPFFILLNYSYFFKSKRYMEILIKKPKFFKSNIISILVVSLFFVATISCMFIGPYYLRQIFEAGCKK